MTDLQIQMDKIMTEKGRSGTVGTRRARVSPRQAKRQDLLLPKDYREESSNTEEIQ